MASMAITSGVNYLLPPKSFQTRQASFSLSANPRNSVRFIRSISSVNRAAIRPNSTIVVPPGDDKQRRPRMKSTSSAMEWAVDSWKTKDAYDKLPPYPEEEELESVLETLQGFPPLVFAGEARKLEERLAEAARGKTFLLQGGYCAESFNEFNADDIRDIFTLLLQMDSVLTFVGQVPVIKVGRIAGQFSRHNYHDPYQYGNMGPREKPRLGRLPSYRGDNVNGAEFDMKARTPDPQRLIRAYYQSAATLNFLRAFATDGLHRITDWNLNFTDTDNLYQYRYCELATKVDKALEFMSEAGVTMDNHHIMRKTIDFWTSHECLHLPYEQSLIRMDSTSGLYYDCSAHMLWVGERTRQLDGAHVEFLRGVANPLGIKVSHRIDSKELVKLIKILNPQNKPGRITLITRMEELQVRYHLQRLIRAVKRSGQIVTWVVDPMHANIFKGIFLGEKVACFNSIKVSACFAPHFSPHFLIVEEGKVNMRQTYINKNLSHI
ncbi:hypothetical protein LguiB_018157 [Lonicera macranthoides]